MPDHSEHFSTTELRCRCGCGQALMDADFLKKFEDLRTAYGASMIVTSGYRCPAHNTKISHTGAHGPHTTGCAIDIKIHDAAAYKLLLLALQFGFSGLGVSQRGPMESRFLHIDNLPHPAYPRPRVWSY